MVLKKVERRTIASIKIIVLEYAMKPLPSRVHGSFFAGYVQVASQNLL